jgi:hypothetical protein
MAETGQQRTHALQQKQCSLDHLVGIATLLAEIGHRPFLQPSVDMDDVVAFYFI